MSKLKVYLETSVVGYLTARPSHDVIKNAMQLATQEWWEVSRNRIDLFISELVIDEARRGDSEAARRRLDVVQGIRAVEINESVYALAEALLAATAVPHSSFDDAVHIAAAAIAGVDILATWNCKHIANPTTEPLIRKTCENAGYRCPVICTPLVLLKGGV